MFAPKSVDSALFGTKWPSGCRFGQGWLLRGCCAATCARGGRSRQTVARDITHHLSADLLLATPAPGGRAGRAGFGRRLRRLRRRPRRQPPGERLPSGDGDPRPQRDQCQPHSPSRSPQRLCQRCCRDAEPQRRGGPLPRVRPRHRGQRRERHRPGHLQDHLDVPGPGPPPARRAVAGHEDALRQQRQRQRAHPHRPQDGQAGDTHPGHRPLQPLLHARRHPGDRRPREVLQPGLP